MDPIVFSILVLLLVAAGSGGIFLLVASTRLAPDGLVLPDEATMHYRLGWSGGLLGLALLAQAETMRVFAALPPTDPTVLAFLVPGILLTCTGLTVAAQVLWNQPAGDVSFPNRPGVPAHHAWSLVGGTVLIAFVLAVAMAHHQVGRLDDLLQSPGTLAASTLALLANVVAFLVPGTGPGAPGAGSGILIVAGGLATAAILALLAERFRLPQRLRQAAKVHLQPILDPEGPGQATAHTTGSTPGTGHPLDLGVLAQDLDAAVEVYDPISDSVDYVSPGSERFWGVPASTLQGSRDAWTQTVHPDDQAAVMAQLDSSPGPGVEGEYRVVHPNGNVRWVRDRVVPEDPNDPASRLVRIAEDITDEKEAQAQIRHTQERYRTLVEQAPDLIATYDPVDWSLLHVNAAVERILGYRPTEWEGEHFLDLVHPDDEAAAATLFESLADGAYPDPAEVRVRHRNGAYRYLELHGTPVKEDDHVVAVQAIARDVTDRHEAEAKLRASEERFQRILDTVNDVVWLLTPEPWTVRYLSKSFERVFGLSRDELEQDPQRFMEIVHPDDVARVEEAFQPQGTLQIDVEYRIHHPERGLRWIHTRGQLADDGGSIAGVSRDITRERRLQDELAGWGARWRNLVEHHPDHLVEVDRDGRIVYANHLPDGMDKAEMVGRRFHLQVPEESRERVAEVLERVLDTREATSLTIEGPLGGVDRVLECRVIPMGRNEGSGTGAPTVLVAARDVTAQRHREAEATLLDERMGTYLETTYDMLFVVDPDTGCYTSVSPNVERIMGWGPERIIGQPFMDFVHPDDLEAILTTFGKVLEGEAPPPQRVRVRRPDGSHAPVSLMGRPVMRDGEVVEVFGIGRVVPDDDTGRGQELRDLQRNSRELRALATASAHHLQEPVRNIVRFAQIIEARHGAEVPQEVQEYLDHVVQGTRRLQEVSDGLHAYLEVTGRTPNVGPVDLQPVLDDVLEALEERIRSTGAEVTADPAPRVLGTRRDLASILHELLANALAFHGDDPPQVHVGFQRKQDVWVMAVRDEGVGIDPAHHERVFHPLRTLQHHSEHPGAGLGLAVVRHLVEALGGNVWVDSREGEGATFYVALSAPAPDGPEA